LLDNCKVVVLDEADEMLDMGFREDLEEILDAAPPERRTLMFSATMPKGIAELARDYQKDALRLATAGRASAHTDIAYQCVATAPADIESAVVNLLRFHEPPSALLFCATRDNVRRLHASLTERGFAAVALSGEHSQSERNQALQALRDRRARLCVATDVAARGIDLPGLSLVIHVEVPRDAETLQHRSGRTGRAGAKGTAVLIVPYPARRRVERMLQGAGVKAEWTPVPTLEAIAVQDRTRLLESIGEGIGALDDEDKRLGEELLTRHGVEEIASALVRMHRARLPQAEELVDAGPAPRAERRDSRQGNDAGRSNDRGGDRSGEGVWFRLDVGRRDNADPRWIIPLLCRRGGVTKPDIGAIRIFPGETMVEIAPDMAERFVVALKRHATRKGNSAEDQIDISPAGGPPQERSAQRPPLQRTLSARPPGGPNSGPRPPQKPPHRGRG
jgi:ATP-dependent RNA helicase DeaD